MSDSVNHPSHYGGEDNPYEAIKVIEAWNLGFCLGNTIKYISRAGKKGSKLEDLKKARWYLDREIKKSDLPLVQSAPIVQVKKDRKLYKHWAEYCDNHISQTEEIQLMSLFNWFMYYVKLDEERENASTH